MTNGRGMMRFSRGFMRFGKGLPIVPAAVRAEPAFGISTHTLTSSFGANMFWFCFAPWVALDVTVLPPMQPREARLLDFLNSGRPSQRLISFRRHSTA